MRNCWFSYYVKYVHHICDYTYCALQLLPACHGKGLTASGLGQGVQFSYTVLNNEKKHISTPLRAPRNIWTTDAHLQVAGPILTPCRDSSSTCSGGMPSLTHFPDIIDNVLDPIAQNCKAKLHLCLPQTVIVFSFPGWPGRNTPIWSPCTRWPSTYPLPSCAVLTPWLPLKSSKTWIRPPCQYLTYFQAQITKASFKSL